MTEPIDAIPTIYAGTNFRSRLEADWARTLDGLGIVWKYEPELITLPSGAQYLPDFWLPEIGILAGGERPDHTASGESNGTRQGPRLPLHQRMHLPVARRPTGPAGLALPPQPEPTRIPRPLRSRMVGIGLRPRRLPHRMPSLHPRPLGHHAQAVAVP